MQFYEIAGYMVMAGFVGKGDSWLVRDLVGRVNRGWEVLINSSVLIWHILSWKEEHVLRFPSWVLFLRVGNHNKWRRQDCLRQFL